MGNAAGDRGAAGPSGGVGPTLASDDYRFDVFISYSRLDHAWARRLHADLKAKGLEVFLDEQRLQAGGRWELDLQEALASSKHLVVLWSPAAKQSDWVAAELNRFAQIIHSRGTESRDRLLIQVVLEGEENTTLGAYQAIRDVKSAGAYANGAGEVDASLWRGVIARITDATNHIDTSLLVPLLIVSMTASELNGIDAALPQAAPTPSFADVLAHLGVGTKEELAASYGETVRRWRPFCSQDDIETLLTTVSDEINALSRQDNGDEFRWEFVDEDFWSGVPARVSSAVNRLAKDSAVVIIDALSLYVTSIQLHFLNQLHRALANPKALFLVPAPFPTPASSLQLRSLVQHMASRVFEHSYEPPILRGDAYARCNAAAADALDLRAWVLNAVGPQLRPERASAGNAYLRHGRRR